ncbi:MAG TPA: PQQ-binding-like beta-propeller repeat protein [Candidatus Eremiobacteraceae bacterium]
MRPFSAGPIFRNAALVAVALCALGLYACGGGGGSSAVPKPHPSRMTDSGAIPNYVPPSFPSAEWPQFRRDDQRTGNNPNQMLITKANVATLAPKWISNSVGGMFATPIVVNGSVYKADFGGHILSLNEATGATAWTFVTGQDGAFISTPTYSNGVLYEGTTRGVFYAIDAATGALKFKYPDVALNAGYEGSAIVAGGVVYEGVSNLDEETNRCIADDQFVSFSSTSPTILNTLTITPPGSTGASVWASPMIDPQGYAYLATGNTCLGPQTLLEADAILNVGPATMKLNWAEPGPPDSHDLDFGATPVYVDGMVVDGAKDGLIYAFATLTGALAWKTNGGISNGAIIGSPATDGTHIFVPFYVGSTGGAIVALNLDGTVAWTVPTESDENGFGPLSAPAVSQGMIFVGYTDTGCATGPCDGISALDANTGQLLWRYRTTHAIYTGPAIVDGGLFVGEFDGSSVYCFTPNGI